MVKTKERKKKDDIRFGFSVRDWVWFIRIFCWIWFGESGFRTARIGRVQGRIGGATA